MDVDNRHKNCLGIGIEGAIVVDVEGAIVIDVDGNECISNQLTVSYLWRCKSLYDNMLI